MPATLSERGMSPPQRASWRWGAEPSSLQEMRRRLREFATAHGVPERTIDDVVLCACEAATNSVVHAFVDRAPGLMEVVVEAGEDQLTVVVRDDGRGMTPRTDSPGLGLGLPTIGQLTSALDISPGPGGAGTELRMVFAAPGVRGAGPSEPAAVDLLVELDRITQGEGWPERGIDRMVELLVPALGNACAVDVLDEEGVPRRFAARIDGERGEALSRWLRQLRPRVDPPGSAAGGAMRTRTPHMVELTREHIERITTSEQDAQTMAATGIRWWLVVPLRQDDRVLGLLHLGTRAERGRPQEQTVELLCAVADRAAGALAGARLLGELQSTRRRLERILDALGEAVTVTDAEGRLVYTNRAAARLLSEAGTAVAGRGIEELARTFVLHDEAGRELSARDLPPLRAFSEGAAELTFHSAVPGRGLARWLATRAELLDEQPPMALAVTREVGAARERDEALAQLDALFSSAPVGLALFDLELRYRRANQALADFSGVPVAERLGRRVTDVPGSVERMGEIISEVLVSGEPVIGAMVERDEGAEHRVWRCSAFPVRDRHERLLGAGLVVEEVTELRRTQEALRHERLVLREIIDRVPVGIVLSWGREVRFALVNESGRRMLPDRESIIGRSLSEVFPEIAEQALALYAQVFESGRMLTRRDFAISWSPEPGGGRFYDLSLVPVPHADGRSVEGVIAVYLDVTSRVRQDAALRRRLQAEHEIAETLQRALLPAHLPEIPGVRLAARYQAAGEAHEVGGDFYDVFCLRRDPHRWLVVVGDACGKGPEAAALTAMIRHTLRAEAEGAAGPAELLTRLNEAMLHQRAEGTVDFATIVCAMFDRRAAGPLRLRMALGGHPGPVVLRGAKDAGALEYDGHLVGALPGVGFEEHEHTLAPGESIVFYTDGVLDAGAPAVQMTPEMLARELAAREPDGAEAVADAVGWVVSRLGPGPRDDMAVVVLGVDG